MPAEGSSTTKKLADRRGPPDAADAGVYVAVTGIRLRGAAGAGDVVRI